MISVRGGKCWLHGKNESSSLDGLYISGADDDGDEIRCMVKIRVEVSSRVVEAV